MENRGTVRYDLRHGHPFEDTCFILRPVECIYSNPYILYLSFTGRLKGGITSPSFLQTTECIKHELLTTKPMSISDFNQTLKTVLQDLLSGQVRPEDRNRVAIERLLQFDPDTEPLAPSSSLPVQREMCELYVLKKTIYTRDRFVDHQRACVVM